MSLLRHLEQFYTGNYIYTKVYATMATGSAATAAVCEIANGPGIVTEAATGAAGGLTVLALAAGVVETINQRRDQG